MEKHLNNPSSTPIPGDIIKDYSLPLSRINSTSSDNKSNPRKPILKRKKKRRVVNNLVRYTAVRFLDSDTDAEDNWITDWEESIDSHSKNVAILDERKTSESTDDSKTLKDSQPKIILKKSTIIRNSRHSSTEGTSKVRGILKGSRKYTSPELIRDAVHVDNLFLEKFDPPLAGTSNHHFQKYTPRIDTLVQSQKEAEKCKGDEFLPIEELPLQLPSALHYPSSDDELPNLTEFVKQGDWKTYEKRPVIVNKRNEIPSKNKTITQIKTSKWSCPKYWLSTANLLWSKFRKLYSSSTNDPYADESVCFADKNSFNDASSSDTSESSNTSIQTENDIRDEQNDHIKRLRRKRLSVNKNINPTVNIRSVNEATKAHKSFEFDKERDATYMIKHISGNVNKRGMSTTKKMLKRNYKKAIPVTDDEDSAVESEIKKPKRKIRKKSRVNSKMSIRDSMLSDGKNNNMKLFKWQCLEVEEEGPWRYDCQKYYKVCTELRPLENTPVESQYAVQEKVMPGFSARDSNKKPKIISVEKIRTRYVLVSGQNKHLLGQSNTEGNFA